jgi:hypothetical protein
MLSAPNDLVGYELVGCTFGKVWMRLELSKSHDGREARLFIDTDNWIRTQRQETVDGPSDGVRSALLAVYECLESTVSGIQVAADHMDIQFLGGSSLTIFRDDESIDSLLKITDPDSDNWLVVD